jgi:hypothetical protein
LRDRDWIPLADFLSESVSIYERSWSVTGVIGWMWRKLVEYSAGDDDKLPSGRYVLRKNLEVYIPCRTLQSTSDSSRFGLAQILTAGRGE